MKKILTKKLAKVKKILSESEKAAVAYSGGTDSTLTALLSQMVLGKNAAAVFCDTELMPEKAKKEALQLIKKLKIRHEVVRVNLLRQEQIRNNQKDRCYICKLVMMRKIGQKAKSLGISQIFDGSNVDDFKAFRPGKKALKELNIRSPLAEAGITKAETRQLARELKLLNWDKPADSCLATRFSYGTGLTPVLLDKVNKAEEILKRYIPGRIRVKVRGNLVRIEAEKQHAKRLFNLQPAILKRVKDLGFEHICLDLEGFNSVKVY